MKKRYTKKRVYKKALRTIILILIASLMTYYIIKSDSLSPGVDQLTASYISFNNPDKTDILKITNINKKKEKKGISKTNESSVSFVVKGEKDDKYQIVLYPIGKVMDDNYVYYYIENKKEKKKLSDTQSTSDGGRIIYQDYIEKDEEFTIRMWIDKELKEKVNPISYEIKIKEWED